MRQPGNVNQARVKRFSMQPITADSILARCLALGATHSHDFVSHAPMLAWVLLGASMMLTLRERERKHRSQEKVQISLGPSDQSFAFYISVDAFPSMMLIGLIQQQHKSSHFSGTDRL